MILLILFNKSFEQRNFEFFVKNCIADIVQYTSIWIMYYNANNRELILNSIVLETIKMHNKPLYGFRAH